MFYQIVENRDKEMAGTEEIIRGYDEASDTYDDYWLSVASEPIHELFDTLEIPAGARALDCGCGVGFTSVMLAARVGSGGSITGIDLSERMIEKARQRAERAGAKNVDFITSDVLEELEPLPPESFDIATLTWLLGYVS